MAELQRAVRDDWKECAEIDVMKRGRQYWRYVRPSCCWIA